MSAEKYRNLRRNACTNLKNNRKFKEEGLGFEHKLGRKIVSFTLSSCSLFQLDFLARDRFFNSHGMIYVGTLILRDSKTIWGILPSIYYGWYSPLEVT